MARVIITFEDREGDPKNADIRVDAVPELGASAASNPTAAQSAAFHFLDFLQAAAVNPSPQEIKPMVQKGNDIVVPEQELSLVDPDDE